LVNFFNFELLKFYNIAKNKIINKMVFRKRGRTMKFKKSPKFYKKKFQKKLPMYKKVGMANHLKMSYACLKGRIPLNLPRIALSQVMATGTFQKLEWMWAFSMGALWNDCIPYCANGSPWSPINFFINAITPAPQFFRSTQLSTMSVDSVQIGTNQAIVGNFSKNVQNIQWGAEQYRCTGITVSLDGANIANGLVNYQNKTGVSVPVGTANQGQFRVYGATDSLIRTPVANNLNNTFNAQLNAQIDYKNMFDVSTEIPWQRNTSATFKNPTPIHQLCTDAMWSGTNAANALVNINNARTGWLYLVFSLDINSDGANIAEVGMDAGWLNITKHYAIKRRNGGQYTQNVDVVPQLVPNNPNPNLPQDNNMNSSYIEIECK